MTLQSRDKKKATDRDRKLGKSADPRAKTKTPRSKEREPAEWDVGRLYIQAGRREGIRPNDLVGAICNETGLTPRAIGAIDITDAYSIVEVPEEIMDDLIGVLRKVRFKGNRVAVRRADAPAPRPTSPKPTSPKPTSPKPTSPKPASPKSRAT
jgi:ATP-dependent RNA helicase DeaD